MTRSPERRESPQRFAEPVPSATESAGNGTNPAAPVSPTQSDKSSDSEGRPVREKLKETRIDTMSSSDAVPASDSHMNDATNGTDATTAGDQSTSGSESGRGRLRRKRSHEDFEDGEEQVKKKPEHHARKKSRDVTSPKDINIEAGEKPSTSSVGRIDEHGDEVMTTAGQKVLSQNSHNRPSTPEAGLSDKGEAMVTSPKNKRSRDQASSGDGVSIVQTVEAASKATQSADKTEEERNPKRQRDKSEPLAATATKETHSKILPGSGFANTSAASPFASISPRPTQPSASEKPAQDLPQTSDEKFKASGFGNFASTSASPFGGLGNSNTKSPFAAAPSSGNKLSSFASNTNTSTTTGSGFGTIGGSSSISAFGAGSSVLGGGSTFGGSLGKSTFGGLGGSKSGLSSFATPGSNTIRGLSSKPVKPFGAAEEPSSDVEGDDEDGNDEDGSDEEGSEKSKPTDQGKRFSFAPQESIETGEEGEEPIWTGRGKLYTFDGEPNKKVWQERGVGPFKLNVTREAPKKARFILRADGTHRLLLNAAVTRTFKFGTSEGEKPTDGKLLFSSPSADGTVEMHLIKMKAERAAELWERVSDVKQFEL